MKKLITILLSMVMVVSFAVSIFAAEAGTITDAQRAKLKEEAAKYGLTGVAVEDIINNLTPQQYETLKGSKAELQAAAQTVKSALDAEGATGASVQAVLDAQLTKVQATLQSAGITVTAPQVEVKGNQLVVSGAVSVNGETVTVSETVTTTEPTNPEPTNPEPTNPPTDAPTVAPTNSSVTSPETGDENPVTMLLMMMVVSVAVMLGVGVVAGRKHFVR